MSQKELNIRHKIWVELLKDYNCIIEYHLRKANIVTDALSRKLRDTALISQLGISPSPKLWEMRRMNMKMKLHDTNELVEIMKI